MHNRQPGDESGQVICVWNFKRLVRVPKVTFDFCEQNNLGDTNKNQRVLISSSNAIYKHVNVPDEKCMLMFCPHLNRQH